MMSLCPAFFEAKKNPRPLLIGGVGCANYLARGLRLVAFNSPVAIMPSTKVPQASV